MSGALEPFAQPELAQQFLGFDWPRYLVDLSTFGIIVRPTPMYFCCLCHAPTRGYEEGHGLDNVCSDCYFKHRPYSTFYTAQTVRVSEPMTFRANAVQITDKGEFPVYYNAVLGIVVIEGQVYIYKLTSSVPGALYDLSGQLIEPNALHMDTRDMDRIYQTQQPL